jgi:hypothetical protein
MAQRVPTCCAPEIDLRVVPRDHPVNGDTEGEAIFAF